MSDATPSPPLILWFRNDLRLEDHAALSAAAETRAPVIPVYIFDDSGPSGERLGGASCWWLDGSLEALAEGLESLGSRLILRRGAPARVLDDLVRDTEARAVYFSRGYEPQDIDEEQALAKALRARDVECRRFRGRLLYEPEEIKTKSGTPFKVFTPYYRACLAARAPKSPLTAPKALRPPDAWPDSDRLSDWQLRPRQPDWATGLAQTWRPGSAGAQARLDGFLSDRVASYEQGRDHPHQEATSKLSPHLHFGEISPRQVWHRIAFECDRDERKRAGAAAYQRQLVWRDFSHYLLFHWPETLTEPFNARFAEFPWRQDQRSLQAWQQGRTGYPIVDAGMRQLWQTGWMHNRVRMVVASFLTKHLRLHWREGADWFWDTLVDADRANNTQGWQWVAGCGADAAPYFRIFNPILQGQKFDPDGAYVRAWVPELKEVADKFVHNPWQAPAPPDGYPSPIVDHKAARQRALAAYGETAD